MPRFQLVSAKKDSKKDRNRTSATLRNHEIRQIGQIGRGDTFLFSRLSFKKYPLSYLSYLSYLIISITYIYLISIRFR